MLGVLKRRWKPKRASKSSRYATDLPSVEISEKPTRLNANVRQVHPVCEDKTHVITYEKSACIVAIESIPTPTPAPLLSAPPTLSSASSIDTTPAPYQSKRSSTDSNPSPTTITTTTNAYPLTPNICVESGRIEFIKSVVDATTTSDDVSTPPLTPNVVDERITVTRGSQTEYFENDVDVELIDAKEKLEIRVAQLESALEAAQAIQQRDKQIVGKLQRQLVKRESSHRDADRERRLRIESEAKTKQALQEAARFRSRLRLLTNEFTKMEETVRSLLVYKSKADQLKQEKAALTVAFENRCQHYKNTISRLNEEVCSLKEQLERVNLDPVLFLKEGTVASQTAALHIRQAEETRKQYERCLDDVANQVVRALLAQKGLKEEISHLHKRIEELESQNCTLTSMLLQQLRDHSTSLSDSQLSSLHQFALEDCTTSSSADVSPSQNFIKHCNSFDLDILDEENKSENVGKKYENRLSADSNLIETRLSLDDKKRHQALTKLWTELKGSEVTPKRLLQALSTVDPSFRLPPQRPVSLNLHLPLGTSNLTQNTFKSRPLLGRTNSKSEEETTGNESPESGNRDEGYSTMSSDVQADVTKGASESTVHLRGLEELKEAIDETDVVETRLIVAESNEPDILYIPINLLSLNSRNSYPPSKEVFPFQHAMRSFSDSHLCIKITTSPSPCYSLSSQISSSPSILLLDITDRKYNPLRRTKATASLTSVAIPASSIEKEHKTNCSSLEDHLECTNWDAEYEYIQHWLLLDETRSAIQQHQRDLLELDYDRTELEDWSLSLSNDDLRSEQIVKKSETVTTPSSIHHQLPLPSIQENNTLELEEDANECLWNNPSYMVDRDGHDFVKLLMDAGNVHVEKQWPYAAVLASSTTIENNNFNLNNSPENSSWSSNGSDCYRSYEPEAEPEPFSKRSSAALSGCSDDTGEIPVIGTDFTRDFYRLVKFESTKSLASTSSRSLAGALSENGDREMALQNVLTFIAEQQMYALGKDSGRPRSDSENTKDFNVEAAFSQSQNYSNIHKEEEETNVNYQSTQSTRELTMNEKTESYKNPNISYAEEVCLVTPLDVECENCWNISDYPVDICSSINVDEISAIEELDQQSLDQISDDFSSRNTASVDLTNESLASLSSSVATNSDVTISKIPRLKQNNSKTSSINLDFSQTRIKSNPNVSLNSNSNNTKSKISKSKIPYKRFSTPIKQQNSQNQLNHEEEEEEEEKRKEETNDVVTESCDNSSNIECKREITIIDGPPHRATSFHERATSKDVIDELNRIIQKGDEGIKEQENKLNLSKLDSDCKTTGWVHVEKGIDLTDPKARANLLDVMLASVSSDSSPTSSCGGSNSDSNEEPPSNYGHLHRIHKFHRQKKVNAQRPDLAVIRMRMPPSAKSARPSIVDRPDFYVRYGEKEREAVACFDFLDDFKSNSSSSSNNSSPRANGTSCASGNI